MRSNKEGVLPHTQYVSFHASERYQPGAIWLILQEIGLRQNHTQ
jgi:hypothetical protein